MQFNLFSWVREGVKRSVMMGVADAIEQVGTPPTGKDLQDSLRSFMKNIDAPLEASTAVIGSSSSANRSTGRKRLGRSLKEIE